MKSNLNDTLWTAVNLMEFLGFGRTSFYLAKRRGDLPPGLKLGRGIWRWDPQTVKRWVAEKETKVKTDPVLSNRSMKAVQSRKSNAGEPINPRKRRGRPTKHQQVTSKKVK